MTFVNEARLSHPLKAVAMIGFVMLLLGSASAWASPTGELAISPTSHDFGTLLSNQDTGTQVFTVTNSGAAGSIVTMSSENIASTDPDFSDFWSISSSTCDGATLAQGESCAITVQFAPTDDRAFSAQLNVSGTDANTTSVSIFAPLSGAGETKAIFHSAPAPVPTMSVWSLSLMALMLMLMAGFGMRTVRARR